MRTVLIHFSILTALLITSGCSNFNITPSRDLILIEAEAFTDHGGWVLDQQSMDLMGSPYLLAHGLGEPVRDATTTLTPPAPGRYRLWVRTKDWVAPWHAPGTPGKFQVVINGQPLPVIFGTEGAEWHWQDGGVVDLTAGENRLALRDLTGFDGRCDAILFCRDLDLTPPNDLGTLAEYRRKALGLPRHPDPAGAFDLVVAGGGIAGTCAALSAARLGLSVALVQDRPVLGGNNSSEVRVWLGGDINQAPYPRIGDVVRELEPARKAHVGPENTAEIYEDARRLALVRAESNISLFLEHRVNGVEMNGTRIQAVIAQSTRTGRRIRLTGRTFADCTGDGTLGALAGADAEITPAGRMGSSNLWHAIDTGAPVTFPRCPWALDLTDKPFPGRGDHTAQNKIKGLAQLGTWFWESGFDGDPIRDVELVRDWNLRAMFGAWDVLKNVDHAYPNHKLHWAAYISGKRESRRLLGDVLLTGEDIKNSRTFKDGCVPCTWHIDLHYPIKEFAAGFEGREFISYTVMEPYKRPYWLPYRCLYSRNIDNLFMAGRDISVTHEALGAIRVMRTGGMMGEIVGMAASLCKKHDTNPRTVGTDHLNDLQYLMRRGVGHSPTTKPKP